MSAIAIGAMLGGVLYIFLSATGIEYPWDFTWAWRAARALSNGLDPYLVINPTGPFPFDAPLKYPLPAALIALPVAHLAPALAGAVFMGVSAALLAFALSHRGWWRLMILASAPFLMAVTCFQWSPIVTAAALLPAAGGLMITKPTIGVALFAAIPRRSAAIGCIALFVITFVIIPDWPREWFHIVATNTEAHYRIPLTTTVFGPLLLLALLRWRTPEGRLLFLMACVPQTMVFYDQLPLFLIPSTKRELVLATMCSQLGYLAVQVIISRSGGWLPIVSIPWCFASCYLPALAMVLRHPNEGPIPLFVERALRRARSHLDSGCRAPRAK